MGKLENRRSDVQLLVDAVNRNAEIIVSKVDAQLQKGDDLMKGAYEVQW